MDIQKVKKNQAQFLQDLKNKQESYHVKVENADIVVHPNVFPPTTDTRLLAKHIKVSQGERILDLTTGSGALAIVAGLHGGSGIAVDINPDTVKNANDNFTRLGLQFSAIESDLFTNVPREQFDLIISNGPYIEGEIAEALEYAFYGAKKYINLLFSNAPSYLKKNGKLLVTFAEWGILDHFEQSANNNGFTFTILDKDTSSDGERTYRLYEFTFNNTRV